MLKFISDKRGWTLPYYFTVHRCLNGRAPSYLSDHCTPLSAGTRQQLCSTNRNLLAVPRHRFNTSLSFWCVYVPDFSLVLFSIYTVFTCLSCFHLWHWKSHSGGILCKYMMIWLSSLLELWLLTDCVIGESIAIGSVSLSICLLNLVDLDSYLC